jgi:pterin-4a-carbinolamine dehydratase
MNAYKCTYNEVNRKLGTKKYGQLMQRTRKFDTFSEAVTFTRTIATTNLNMVGKPVIEIMEPAA